MNQTTIGSYIAQKRRAKNLTQEQLERKARCVEQDHLHVGEQAFPQLRILLQQLKLTLTKHFAENHI